MLARWLIALKGSWLSKGARGEGISLPFVTFLPA